MAFPLPAKPSIAVLPFDDLSPNRDDAYFADGITETIITALSKHPKPFVIARNSTFTYKGKPVTVQQVAEELGFPYTLEGSVMRSGDRLRVSAQLIDALTGYHVSSEQYDRAAEHVFATQDEIALETMAALQVRLTRPGGAIAAAWAVMKYLGEDGYLGLVDATMRYIKRFQAGINAIEGLAVLGEPVMSVFAYGSTTLDIHAVAAGMEDRGWLVSKETYPLDAIQFMQSPGHEPYVDEYLRDLADVVELVADGRLTARGPEAKYT